MSEWIKGDWCMVTGCLGLVEIRDGRCFFENIYLLLIHEACKINLAGCENQYLIPEPRS